jgi:hypothetical protein
MMIGTPLAIEMAIWYHTRADEDCPNWRMPAQQAILNEFLAEGLLEYQNSDPTMRGLQSTDRMRRWIVQLCSAPLPASTTEDVQQSPPADLPDPKTGGPAFPSAKWVGEIGMTSGGLTIRDIFAGLALHGTLCAGTSHGNIGDDAADSYTYADAMMTERAKWHGVSFC